MAQWRGPGSGRVVAGTVLLLLVVAGCIRLGFWQLERLEQRRALNARIAERMRAPVLPDRLVLADTGTSFYRRATVTGRYDDERSIVLPGRAFNGVPGVHLLTPLLLDAEAAVLVNRGWVPSADAATIPLDSFPASRPGQDAERLTGLVLPLPVTNPQPVGRRTEDAGFRRVWYRLDPALLQAQFPYRILPLQLQLLPRRNRDSAPERSRPEADAPAWPMRLPPPELDQGPHLSYAIQWFSFAAIGIIGWLALIRRSRRPGAAVILRLGAAARRRRAPTRERRKRPDEPSEAGDLLTPGGSGSDVA